MLQARAYARANGVPCDKQETDRSLVYYKGLYYPKECYTTFSTSLSPQINPLNTWILIMCIFILSNMLILTSTVLYFREVFCWLQQKQQRTKTLYRASAIVLTIVNMGVLISDISCVIRDNVNTLNLDNTQDYPPVLYSTLYFILSAKGPLVLLILILETPVACFNTHELNQVNNKRRYRIAHAFALCQIIWFVHRLVTDAIIAIVFFVIAPAQTLGVVTLLLSTIGGAIVFVAVMIHNGCNKRRCSSIFWATINGVFICGLLFVTTLFYIVLVDNGLKSSGMGGIILLLIPLFVVFVIGLIVNQKFFHTTTAHSETRLNTTTELQETNRNTAIQNDDGREQETWSQNATNERLPLLP